MKKIIMLSLGIITFLAVGAQENPPTSFKKHSPNIAMVKTFDGKVTKGWFYQVNDSQVVLLDKRNEYLKMVKSPDANRSLPTRTFQIDQISSISVRKNNAAIKGFLIGLGTGILTGVIGGFISGDDPVQPYTNNVIDDVFVAYSNTFAMTAGQKALFGAIGLGATGGLTGLIIGGLAKKKFIIGGSRKKVRDLDGELRQRLLLP
jgi:hypothetical protein